MRACWAGQLSMENPPMFATLTKLLKNEDGATAIEYGLIAALIAVAAVTVLGTVGTNLTGTFSTVATKL
jgi:pilus assembly protein Flp/PilA